LQPAADADHDPPRLKRMPLDRRSFEMRIKIQTVIGISLILLSCASRPKALSVHLADYSDRPISDRLRVDMPNGEAPLYAETRAILDEDDFRSASFGNDGSGQPQLRLCFAPSARDKFTSMAQQNLHRRLVFLVEGKLLFAPVIDSAAAPECLEISGAVTPAQAEVLRRAIR
jgi:preprotein translocase subunit SecD